MKALLVSGVGATPADWYTAIVAGVPGPVDCPKCGDGLDVILTGQRPSSFEYRRCRRGYPGSHFIWYGPDGRCPACFLVAGSQSGGNVIQGCCWDCYNPACSCGRCWSQHVEPGRFDDVDHEWVDHDGNPAPPGLSKERWACMQFLVCCQDAKAGRCRHRCYPSDLPAGHPWSNE